MCVQSNIYLCIYLSSARSVQTVCRCQLGFLIPETFECREARCDARFLCAGVAAAGVRFRVGIFERLSGAGQCHVALQLVLIFCIALSHSESRVFSARRRCQPQRTGRCLAALGIA